MPRLDTGPIFDKPTQSGLERSRKPVVQPFPLRAFPLVLDKANLTSPTITQNSRPVPFTIPFLDTSGRSGPISQRTIMNTAMIATIIATMTPIIKGLFSR